MASTVSGWEAWRDVGHTEDFGEHKVHCYFHDGVDPEPPLPKFPLLLFLHGFPTCSYDWAQVIQNLPTHPILAFDFLGFGLSDKPKNYNYTLSAHADLALDLIKKHNEKGRQIFIIAHDMGTSVCAEILARQLDSTLPTDVKITGALLFNGNMVMEKASLVLGQRLLRSWFGSIFAALSTKPIFMWQFGSAVSKDSRKKPEYEDQWKLLCYNGGNYLLHKTIQYTFERVEKSDRLLGAIRKTEVPLSFAWGMDDPVATAALQLDAWKSLRPSAHVYEFPGLGHYPQMEDPETFVRILRGAIDLNIKAPFL